MSTVEQQLTELLNQAVRNRRDPDKPTITEIQIRRDRNRDRKRDQRLRDSITAAEGQARLTSESIQHALLDALALLLNQGDPDGHAAAVIAAASKPFVFPPQAANVITRRLRTRLPHVMIDQLR